MQIRIQNGPWLGLLALGIRIFEQLPRRRPCPARRSARARSSSRSGRSPACAPRATTTRSTGRAPPPPRECPRRRRRARGWNRRARPSPGRRRPRGCPPAPVVPSFPGPPATPAQASRRSCAPGRARARRRRNSRALRAWGAAWGEHAP
jgi:hypothetical protein